MMHETNHAIRDKRGERPAARLTRHDQMTPRRDLQIGKPERFALQGHTTVKFFDGCAFTNLNLFHAFTVLIRCVYRVYPLGGRAGILIVASKPRGTMFCNSTLPFISSSSLRLMIIPSSLLFGSCVELPCSGSNDLV